jgi:hypothetical protein
MRILPVRDLKKTVALNGDTGIEFRKRNNKKKLVERSLWEIGLQVDELTGILVDWWTGRLV